MIQCWNSNCHAELRSLPNHAVKIVAGTTALQIFQCLTCFGPRGMQSSCIRTGVSGCRGGRDPWPEHFFRGSAVGDNKSVTFELYFWSSRSLQQLKMEGFKSSAKHWISGLKNCLLKTSLKGFQGFNWKKYFCAYIKCHLKKIMFYSMALQKLQSHLLIKPL